MRLRQIWTNKDKRRPGYHRVIWVSPCGGYARVIRVGTRHGHLGRYVKVDNFQKRYRHHATSATTTHV